MKLYRLYRTQVLPVPLDEAWDFFSAPGNLNDITPPWMKFEITSGTLDAMFPGQIITYQIELLPKMPQAWVTEITHVVPKTLFVDEQRFGPYKFWHHLHRFAETGAGVEMTDLVHYALPFGPLGRATHAVAVGRALDAIFDYRRRVLAERFGG